MLGKWCTYIFQAYLIDFLLKTKQCTNFSHHTHGPSGPDGCTFMV